MSDVKIPAPSLTDLAARINTDFEDIKQSEINGNRGIVERGIAFGEMLNEAKAQVGHGRWVNWVKDNCPKISKSTAERYMKLAKSPEVRAELGKNSTRDVFSLRKALLMANPPPPTKKVPTDSDRYDSAENNLIDKLAALAKSSPPETFETAAVNTIQRLTEAVTRLKPPA